MSTTSDRSARRFNPRAWLPTVIGLLSVPALAVETVTIQPTWNLRRTAGKTRRPKRTVREATTATLLARRGQWRLVCIGGEGYECSGGERGWVFARGIRANDRAVTDGADSGVQCVGEPCQSKGEVAPALKKVEPLARAISQNPTGYTLPRKIQEPCAGLFLSKNGLGPWGRRMVKTAEYVAKDCMFNSDIFDPICPNYRELTPPQKSAFLGLFFGVKAFYEATCDENNEAQGVNDVADGMFQMERTRSVRHGPGRRPKRNPRWCKTEVEINAKNPTFQAECTISIIQDTVCSKGLKINRAGGYWAQLQGNGLITSLVRSTALQQKLCRER